jgi:acid stress-induced BolA-like protein IbaG/YrbA
MISPEDLQALIVSELPDAQVQAIDKTGMSDHYIVMVASESFADMGTMDRHRAVYAAVTPALQDGRLHAIEIKTQVPTPR